MMSLEQVLLLEKRHGLEICREKHSISDIRVVGLNREFVDIVIGNNQIY